MNTYTERSGGSVVTDFLSENAQVLSIAFFFVMCVVFFANTTDTFLTTRNLLNVIRQAAPILVVAVAMTLVIITGGIDLSVGSMVALVRHHWIVAGLVCCLSGHTGVYRDPGRTIHIAWDCSLSDAGLFHSRW